MTEAKFIESRKLLQAKKAELEEQINIEYTKICDDFKNVHSPVELLKVYELKENGRKRRGFKRFVIYSIELRVFYDTVNIVVAGWWLDKQSIPSKWDNMTVKGIGNPAIFELSEDQTNHKHPESTYSDDSN